MTFTDKPMTSYRAELQRAHELRTKRILAAANRQKKRLAEAKPPPAPAVLHPEKIGRRQPLHPILTLQNLVPDTVAPTVKIATIVTAVARVLGIPQAEIHSKKRSGQLNLARGALYYLAREMSARSWSDIGRFLNRDHSTLMKVMATVRRNLSRYEPIIRAALEIIVTEQPGMGSVETCPTCGAARARKDMVPS